MPPTPNPIRIARRTTAAAARQVPDRALRTGRRIAGSASLRDAVGGRVVMIGDAGEGVGRAVAERVAGAGATVLLAGGDAGALGATADAIAAAGPERPRTLAFDPARREAVAEAAATAIEWHQTVDVLVNAPALPHERARGDDPGAMDLAQRALQAGYFAPVRMILALVPAMRLRGRGHVVNVSLAAGGAHEPGVAAHVAAAVALDAFSRCLAPELDDLRIPITMVHLPLEPGERGARSVCDALIHKPRRVGTAWGTRDPVSALAPVLTGG